MCWRTCRRFAKAAALLLAIAAPVSAQEVPADLLLKPTSDSWPTYHGDYSGRHHSALTQITPANVKGMTLAWAFQTNLAQSIKATPILVNGVIYLSAPDNVWAVDARSGRQLWRYTHPANDGFKIGHRGVAVRGDLVYVTTPDAHLLALDARTGAVRWNVEIADSRRGYWSTNAPLVIRDHVIVGVSGDFDNLPGILKSFDPVSGAPQWTFYSTPVPGTPGSISGGATGGQMWMTGTYDPELNLLYVGTGNPTPVLNGPARPGDNKWTGSIVALNPDTGTMAWGFQAVPHDTHDWDAAEVPVLVDADFRGAPRKLLLQASRNGYYFVLDRVTGQNLLTTPFAAVNWATGIDAEGRPIPNPDKEPSRAGRLVAPDEAGGTNYRSPAFDPATGLLIVSAHDAYGIYFFKPEHGSVGWAGADYTVHGRGVLRAIEYQTGRIRWSHDLSGGAGAAGVLTTASGITFTGDSAMSALALRTSDGATLWHSGIGRVGNSPITYELDGRQYVLFGGGGVLYAWALPQAPDTSADRPVARIDANSQLAHAQLVEKARRGRVDVYFVGDSITRRWGALDYPLLLKHWTTRFFGWNVANFGWGGDTTQNILWRLQNGEFDGLAPKVVVVQAGTNNVAASAGREDVAAAGADVAAAGEDVVADVTRGVTAIVDLLRAKAPDATIVLTAIFPRNDNPSLMPAIDGINRNLAGLGGRSRVRFLNVNDRLADRDGRLHPGMMGDGLHPAVAGYQVWADALTPILAEILGPPAADDHAPPATGDPSAPSRREPAPR